MGTQPLQKGHSDPHEKVRCLVQTLVTPGSKKRQGRLKQDAVIPLRDVDKTYGITSAKKDGRLDGNFSMNMQGDHLEVLSAAKHCPGL